MDNSTEFEFSDYTQRAIVATLILTTSIVGIIGNSLALVAVLLSKTLQTPTIAFIVNLSTAHLMTCLVLPCDVVALLGKDGLPVAEWICSVTTVVISITIGCGIYTLAFIGLNHLLLITRPATTYRRIYTPKNIAVWLVVTWLIPFLVIVAPPLINVGEVGYSEKYHICGSKSTSSSFQAYNYIRVLGLYPIPLVCIIVCYVLIWRHVHRQAKGLVSSADGHIKPMGHDISMVETSHTSSDQPGSSPTSSGIISQSAMITKTMPFVVCGFVLFLTPYSISLLIGSIEQAVPYSSAILFASTCIYPIIYGIRHSDFKAVFGCLLRCRWDDIPQPSAFLKAMRQINCCRQSAPVRDVEDAI